MWLSDLDKGVTVTTSLTSGGWGATTLIQLDGDVVLSIHRRFVDDLDAQRRHQRAVGRRLARLRAWHAILRAAIPLGGGVSAVATLAATDHTIGAVIAVAWAVVGCLVRWYRTPSPES